MNSYKSKECAVCAIVLPANKMKIVDVPSATWKSKSRKSVNFLTFIGLLFGSKKARSAIESWLFNTSGRTSKGSAKYFTKYVCSRRCKRKILGISFIGSLINSLLKFILLIILFLFIIFLIRIYFP